MPNGKQPNGSPSGGGWQVADWAIKGLYLVVPMLWRWYVQRKTNEHSQRLTQLEQRIGPTAGESVGPERTSH